MPRLRPSVRLPGAAAAIVAWTGAALAQDGYELGRGYDIGPFNVAGYSNIVADARDGGRRALFIDDLSLFVSGHLGRMLNPFVEVELSELMLFHSRGPDGTASFVVERLYNDAYLTDRLTVRLGRMLAPVGEWNGIHAAPLVPTTVRPAVTYRNFGAYATGAALLYGGSGGAVPDVQLYWQPDRDLARPAGHPETHRYGTVAGLHVSWPAGLLDRVGASFQYAESADGAAQQLYGVDAHYTLGRVTLRGEASVVRLSGAPAGTRRDTEWGAYASAAYALDEQWSAFTWYEGFAERGASAAAHDLLVGIAFRPVPATVLKVEYLQNVGGRPVNPTGLYASWSVLF